MTEEPNKQTEAPEQAPDPATPSDETQNTGSGPTMPMKRFNEVLGQRNDVQRELDTFKQAEQERQRKQLEEDGNFKQIIDEMIPQVERAKILESQLLEYQARDKAELEQKLAGLDVGMQGLMTDSGLDTAKQLALFRKLEAAGAFNKPTAPTTDSGAKGDPKKPDPNLTEAQQELIEMSKQYGYGSSGE